MCPQFALKEDSQDLYRSDKVRFKMAAKGNRLLELHLLEVDWLSEGVHIQLLACFHEPVNMTNLLCTLRQIEMNVSPLCHAVLFMVFSHTPQSARVLSIILDNFIFLTLVPYLFGYKTGYSLPNKAQNPIFKS